MENGKRYSPQSLPIVYEKMVFFSSISLGTIAFFGGLLIQNPYIIAISLIFIGLAAYSFQFEKWRISSYEFGEKGIVIAENILNGRRMIQYKQIDNVTSEGVHEMGRSAQLVVLHLSGPGREPILFSYERQTEFREFIQDLGARIGADKIERID